MVKGQLDGMLSDPRSDEDLIVALQNGEIGALEVFYERHRVLAYSLALRALASTTDAEDVVQEAFLNVWRAAGTYRRERSNPRSWLLSIVHHRSIDKLRSRQSRPRQAALEEGFDMADSTDVWQEVAGNITGERVRAALAQLPDEQREAIELAYFKGYTQSQIAELQNLPLGTVKGRMRIGLHKLKGLLDGTQRELAIE